MRQPKKAKIFGDGTELDGFEDLSVEKEKESKYRVAPTGSGNILGRTRSGTVGRSSGNPTSTNETIGRKRGVPMGISHLENGGLTGTKRPGSSASSQGSVGAHQFPS